ncbi:hypothetical protein BGZ60DRAFT_405007 [Tricladium varicosporioides]|nr:hypothetical protein BGZ60DRAFT_405007 [Hymenoscyphus varicosporioides]
MRLLLSFRRRPVVNRWKCLPCNRYISTETESAKDTGKYLSPQTYALRAQGPARTRFAPSPTGFLHLGSLRTALFNYLIAKATGGQFLLRIEDTDQKRTVPGAEERLYQDLEWAGIEWDEGPQIGGPFGPYKQSERTAIYRKYAGQLLASGNAYRCFCTADRLHDLAEFRARAGLPPDYDRTCAHVPKEESDYRAAKGEAHVVRFKVPDVYPVYRDEVYGLIRQRREMTTRPIAQASALGSFDDPILLKTDGFPTYHLANVVDDHLMEISHVIRGSEWMSSTPKHLAMYQAFGWKPPLFAHVGLLVDKAGQKFSKRMHTINLSEWRDHQGIFPEVLTNFVALLGWSHNRRLDVMNMRELIENASMKFTRGDTIVAFEKLWFLQRKHAARYAAEQPINEKGEPIDPRCDLNKIALEPLMRQLENKVQADSYSSLKSHALGKPREDYVRALLWADAQNYNNPLGFIDRNVHWFRPASIKELRQATIPSMKLRNVPPQISYPIDTDLLFEKMEVFDQIPPLGALVVNGAPDRASWAKNHISNIIEIGAERSMKGVEDQDGSLQLAAMKGWSKIVHGYLRWALYAGKPGPDMSVLMGALTKEDLSKRLSVARKTWRDYQLKEIKAL